MSSDAASPLLTVRNLSKSFVDPATAQERTVLADIDFSVKTGEVVSLVGPSGSGKTTLLRLIAGLEEPTAGVIHWFGPAASHREIAMLFQDYSRSLFPWLTVDGQLRLA